MLKLIYGDMMGLDVQFGAIYALKLAQSGQTVTEKRAGIVNALIFYLPLWRHISQSSPSHPSQPFLWSRFLRRARLFGLLIAPTGGQRAQHYAGEHAPKGRFLCRHVSTLYLCRRLLVS